jgi:SAM-dependent MidA family methyltransferase
MPFASFMAAALYDRSAGYYSRADRVGRAGDFYTSVSTGAVFGELMAGQFREIWEMLGRPPDFAIVERGANDGTFAADVLASSRAHAPEFHASLTYWIDEPMPGLAARQAETLSGFPGRWRQGSPQGATGVFFANELLDAVPFRRVVRRRGSWRELCVGLGPAGEFQWTEAPLLDRTACARLAQLGSDFPDGYETEIAPAVGSEIRLAAATIAHGALFFIDYGFCASDYYDPARRTGTFRCYRQHQSHENPFDAVGETDITAHVDFSFAAAAARASGCHVAAFLDQSRFLTGAASATLLAMDGDRSPAAVSWRRQFQSLTHPGHLGRAFQVLLLTKAPGAQPWIPSLSGLRFASASALASLG